jgi:hypothetical protein
MAIEVTMRRSLVTRGYPHACVKSLLVLGTIVCAAATGMASAATPFAYDRELGDVARASLVQAVSDGRPFSRANVERVYVRCYRDRRAFEDAFEILFGFPAGRVVAYYVGGPDLHLRNGTCENVRAFMGGRHTVYTAGAYSILLHEALHRQRVGNERITTCLANEAVRWGSLRFGFSEAQALRARNLAFTFMRLFAPPIYFMGAPTCLALTERTEWPDQRRRNG